VPPDDRPELVSRRQVEADVLDDEGVELVQDAVESDGEKFGLAVALLLLPWVIGRGVRVGGVRG
jgi:hypothetical protein